MPKRRIITISLLLASFLVMRPADLAKSDTHHPSSLFNTRQCPNFKYMAEDPIDHQATTR